jgi:CubicO group peptidase (beta-lactamase class C family)
MKTILKSFPVCRVFLLVVVLCSNRSFAQNQSRYIFFLHNRFLENHELNEPHKQYGKANYQAILDSFSHAGFIVLSEKRKPNTNAQGYAKKVVAQIDSLLQLGIAPNHITVIGTSKGGYIAQYVSTYLANPKINFVFIGCYMSNDLIDFPDITFCGNILEIYEHTDSLGVSAINKALASPFAIPHYREVELFTNRQHGFLYKALTQWIRPCIQWAQGDYTLAHSATKANQIDSFLLAAKQVDKRFPFNGVVLIKQNNKIIYNKAIGYADFEKRIPQSLNNSFCVGSISKQMTAVLIMQAVEKNKLSLSKTIHHYLPALKYTWADSVTIHQLLTHTHGIDDNQPSSYLKFKPGTQFNYSNYGYAVLADILAKVYEKPYADLVNQLFHQCKMNESFYPLSNSNYTQKTYSCYLQDSLSLVEMESKQYTWQSLIAAAGLFSTAADLFTWNELFHQSKLLKPANYQQMITPQLNAIREHPLFGKTLYGYGITISPSVLGLQLGQTGLSEGYCSVDFYYPESNTSFIVLENVIVGKTVTDYFYYHLSLLKLLQQ